MPACCRVFPVTQAPSHRVSWSSGLSSLASFLYVLTACAAPPPTPPPTPVPATIPAFVPAADLTSSGPIATIGYLLVDAQGARLAAAVSLADGAPVPIGTPESQIWCGTRADLPHAVALGGADANGAAIVLARGRLEGPGSFGPGGAYARRLHVEQISVIVPEETSVAALLDRNSYYAGRVVRVNGGMLSGGGSAVLVDRLGAGGVPEPGSRQIKLRGAEEDRALVDRLRSSSSGAVRFGAVQVEGYWRDGALVTLAIRPVGT